MLDERKAAILTAVIEEYVKTAQPVGSAAIAKGVHVSSATVRNELAQLESEGFLNQPHTSAGRVPTEKGYRYFVDQIDQTSLSPLQRRRVIDFFAQMRGEIEEVMRHTAGLLTNLTDYAAVVVDGSEDAADVKSVQLVALSSRVVLAVAVLANGNVVKQTIETDLDVSEVDIEESTKLLRSVLEGHPLSRTNVLELRASTPARTSISDHLASLASVALSRSDADHERVYVDGTARVVNAFEAVESVSRVLTILEQQLVVVSLLTDVLDRGLSVAIGSETGVAPLAECSLVVSPYSIDGEHAGSIAVLGPTRMDYAQVMSAVAAVSRQLSTRLTEG